MNTREAQDDASWLSNLGIHDRASGLAKAHESWQRLIDAGRYVLSSADYTVEVVVFSGFLARAQGFHEGAVSAIENDNPYAGFTLLRAYAENAAAILYLKDKPTQLDRFWRNPDDPAISIGKITNYAERRLKGFKAIYGQLSSYAHPAARSVMASHRVNEDGKTVQWSSAPSFKSDRDAMTACGWVVELAEATSHLLVELAGSWKTQRPLT